MDSSSGHHPDGSGSSAVGTEAVPSPPIRVTIPDAGGRTHWFFDSEQDRTDRELREVCDIEIAAQRLAHELRKVAHWRAAGLRLNRHGDAKRLLCAASDRAEECRATLLGAMYAWSQIEAVHDAWKECGA